MLDLTFIIASFHKSCEAYKTSRVKGNLNRMFHFDVLSSVLTCFVIISYIVILPLCLITLFPAGFQIPFSFWLICQLMIIFGAAFRI